jgi:hypothetical protein
MGIVAATDGTVTRALACGGLATDGTLALAGIVGVA